MAGPLGRNWLKPTLHFCVFCKNACLWAGLLAHASSAASAATAKLDRPVHWRRARIWSVFGA
jgi:hypothetical protein